MIVRWSYTGPVLPCLGNGPLWVEQIGEVLNAEYKGHLTVFNRGGSGRNSQWGANNFADSVLSVKPDALIIEFSVNDAVTRFDISPEQSMKNTDYMIRKVREQNPQSRSHPVGGLYASTGKMRRRSTESAILHRRVSYPGGQIPPADHRFHPIWNEIIEKKGEKGFRNFLHDGVHSTKRGALEMIAPNVIEALKTGK